MKKPHQMINLDSIFLVWFGFVLNQIKQTLIDMPWFHHLKLKFGIYCSSIFFVNGLWLKNQKSLFFVDMIHRRYCTLFAILFINFRRFKISHIYFMGFFSILRASDCRIGGVKMRIFSYNYIHIQSHFFIQKSCALLKFDV